MKRLKTVIWIAFFLILCSSTVFANDNPDPLQEQLDVLDFSAMDRFIRDTGQDYKSFGDLVRSIILGETSFSFQEMGQVIVNHIFRELIDNGDLIRNILIIAVLSAILKCLTDSFRNRAVGELGFYATYIVLIMVLYTSFYLAATIVTELIQVLFTLMTAALPLMLTLVVLSGNVGTALAFHPVVYFALHVIVLFIKNVIIPCILMVSAIQIINYISEKENLDNFANLLKKVIGWVLKITAGLFISLLSFQRISTPILNNALTKTAKTAVGAVPVVGQVLAGAVDTVLYWSGAAKSGVIAAVIVVAVVALLVPVLKLVALLLIYKFMAGIIQPVCDERIVECIDAIGSYTGLLIGAATTVAMMFLFFLLMVLSL